MVGLSSVFIENGSVDVIGGWIRGIQKKDETRSDKVWYGDF